MISKCLFAFAVVLLTGCTTYESLALPQGFSGFDAAVEELPQRRGHLGVSVEPNESDSLEDLEIRPGVRVVSVETSSAAEAAGIRPGDILLQFDGTRTDDPDRLESLLLGMQEDKSLTLQLERGGRVFDLDVSVPATEPAGTGRTLYHIERVLLRAAFRNDREDGAFPVVAWLGDDSPLHDAGVEVEDRVISFEGHDPGSAGEFVRRIGLELEPGQTATLGIRTPAGETRSVAVETWDPGSVLTGLKAWPLFIWEEDLAEDREGFVLVDLILFSLFSIERVGDEKEYSILSIFSWRSGEALLESSHQDAPAAVANP